MLCSHWNRDMDIIGTLDISFPSLNFSQTTMDSQEALLTMIVSANSITSYQETHLTAHEDQQWAPAH